MPKSTYSQLTAQIAKLQAQANEIRDSEKQGVVARISEAIKTYGLTARDLFGREAQTKSAPKAARSTKAGAAKFADGSGNVWVGRGPRPQWLRDALAAGKQLNDFAVGGKSAGAAAAAEKPAATVKARGAGKKRKATGARAGYKVKPKYRDEATGDTWTGRGNRPRWLTSAISGGKRLEDFAI